MFFQFKSYLKFLIKSTNKHGIHSPFVYTLTTNCLGKNPIRSHQKSIRKNIQKAFKNSAISSKKETLLANLILYFNSEKIVKIVSSSKNEHLTTLKSVTKTNSPSTEKSVDFVFFDKNSSKDILIHEFETSLKKAHNDSVFVLNNIYSNPEIKKAWEAIKQNPKVTVTIDTYYLGLVFFRSEQEKEHFIIRV